MGVITIKRSGKGPLGKDGKPFRPCNAFTTKGGWCSPIIYSVQSICDAMLDSTIETIEIITEDNEQFTIKKN